MFSTIKNRLIAIMIGIVVLTLLAVTAATYSTVRNHTLAQVTDDLTALSRANAAAMSAWVTTQKDIVSSLAPAAEESNLELFLKQAARSGRIGLAYIGFADKRYMFSDRELEKALPADYDPTQRPWYKLAEQANEPVLTAPYIDSATKKLVVTFALANRSGSSISSVVASDVQLDQVMKTVEALKPTAQGFAFLLDKTGQIIAHPDPALWMKPVTDISGELDAEVLAHAGNLNEAMPTVTVKGERYLLRAVPVEGTDWTLVSAAHRDEVLAPVGALLKAASLVLVLAVVAGAAAVAIAISSMLKGLSRVRDAMNDIGSGSGDLSKRLPVSGSDEISQIAASFNQFAEKIAAVIRDIRGVSGSIAAASSEIAAGNLDLSQRTEQAAANLEMTASSMEEFRGSIQRSAESAQTASNLAGTAASVASRGGQVVAEVVATMEDINNSSKQIADITNVIDGIAFQTNILALNAAVEAARAGEQGKGFAVVASEVRTLAQRCAQAAKEIKELISTSVEKVESGSRQVQKAGSTMQEIVQSVERVTGIIGEISAASTEQSESVLQVSSAINSLDEMTQQNAALVEESAAAAASMKEQAYKLAEVVRTFRLGDEHALGAFGEALAMPAPKQPAPPPAAQVASPSTTRATLPAAAKNEDDWETF